MDLQAVDLLFDLGFVGQEGRYDDKGSQGWRHPVRELETRQRAWAEPPHDDAVNEGDREVGGRDEGHKSQQGQGDGTHARGVRSDEGDGQDQARHDAKASEVAPRRTGHVGSKKPPGDGNPIAELPFEKPPPFRDQIVAGIFDSISGRSAGQRGRPRGTLRSGNRLPGDVEFGAPRAPREVLDRVTVAVAGREVHGAEVAPRTEHFVHGAHALEELRPVEGRHHPHAGDHVADRHVHGGLALVFDSDQLVGRRAELRELFVEPRERGRRLGILLAQALHELHGEGDGQGGRLEPLEGQGPGRTSAEPEQLVGQRIAVMAGGAAFHDLLGQAPEVLQEQQTQGDWNGP